MTDFKNREYHGEFTGWGDGSDKYGSPGYNSVTSQFDAGKIPEPTYVFAEYDCGSYEGSAIVLYKQGRKWYQVYGSHCSCYGLENQWGPEEFDPKLHFEAMKEGKTLLSGYGQWGDRINEWLAHWTKQKVKT